MEFWNIEGSIKNKAPRIYEHQLILGSAKSFSESCNRAFNINSESLIFQRAKAFARVKAKKGFLTVESKVEET
jgi:hypothetical protein